MQNIAISAIAALLASTGLASAASISFSDSISLTMTNWADSVSIGQFDSALGTLNSATVKLDGSVQGDAKGESLDAAPATVSLKLQAEINANHATLGNVVTILPVVDSVSNLATFDGTIDFGGTSGVEFPGVTASDQDTNVFTAATDLIPFIGTGLIMFDVDAAGQSVGTGAGNLITQFATNAQATVTVLYDYDPAVTPPPPVIPLPAGAPLLLAGIGAFAVARRMKKSS